MVVVLIVAAILFYFLNGFHDPSNIVATVISCNALILRNALILTAACDFVAPLIFGVAAATTVGMRGSTHFVD
jgi:PiT family inorganic phosphate transporter